MFGFKKASQVVAPVEGTIIPLSEVPDPVFAQGMLGEGFAVETAGDIVRSPVDGEIIVLFPTAHAFAVRTPKGEEVLVHIGVDTVSLKGEGFHALAAQGDQVKAGTPVVQLTDLEALAEKVPSLVTIVVSTDLPLTAAKVESS